MRSFGSLTIATMTAILVAGATQAQEETYDLLGPPVKKGETIKLTSKMVMKGADLSVELAGQKFEGKADMTGEDEERITILEAKGHKVTKTRVDVVKDTMVTKRSILGNTDKETEDGPFVGRFITSTWSDKQKDWKNTLEGKAPDEEQAEELETYIPLWNESNLFPKEKVKVGHTWQPPIEDWGIAFGGKMKNIEGKVESTFTKVIDFKGEKCAVIESKVKLKGRLPKEKEPLDVTLEGKLITHRSLKTGLDVEENFKGEFEFTGELNEDGMKMRMTMVGPVTLSSAEEFAGLAID